MHDSGQEISQFEINRTGRVALKKSYWTIDRTLSGAIALGQSGSGSDGNEEVLHIPQCSRALESNDLILYPGHALWCGSYPFAEMQSLFSRAPTDWANNMIGWRIEHDTTESLSSSYRAASMDISDPLSLSLHVSLSFIASGRSSGLHLVSLHSCCMYVRAGRPDFDWPYAGVHRSTRHLSLKRKCIRWFHTDKN